jgi:hypothetical protein
MEWIGHIKFTVFPEFGQLNAGECLFKDAMHYEADKV